VVLGYLELLRTSREFEPGDIIQVEEQIRRASGIANQLMTFSKGGLPVKENCSLSKLLEDLFKFLASGSNVKIKKRIDPALWPLFADKAQISAVLENLLKNAKEAMLLGGVVLVEAENECLMEENNLNLPAGPYVRITVLDNGPGIPDHVLKNIFQPWNTTKSAGKGNGLGLYMAYGIIKKHHGQMIVDSAAGNGTKFTLYLPAIPVIASTQNEEQTPQKDIIWHGEKLLILEDEESIINLLKRFFAKQNLRAVFARNSESAIKAYQEALSAAEPFAAVVLDLTIPGGPGGKETIGLLRELDPQVKALVTSGYAEDLVMSKYADHGFRDRIKKPYNLTELNDILNKVIIKD
jgi:CheY-like chemotaxis protein